MQAANVEYHPRPWKTKDGREPGPGFTRTRLDQLQTYRSDCVRAVSDCPNPVHVVSASLGRALELPCRSRACVHCYTRYWLPRTKARMMSGLRGKRRDGDLLLATFTAPGAKVLSSQADITVWNRTAQERLRLVLAAIRHRYPGVAYFKVSEYQERGALHFHVALRRIRFIPHAWLSAVSEAHGFGFCWLSAQPTERRGGVVRYLVKYLTKQAIGMSPKGARVFSMTRDWCLNWLPEREHRSSDWEYCGSGLEAFSRLYPQEGVL